MFISWEFFAGLSNDFDSDNPDASMEEDRDWDVVKKTQ